jgi:hypothetical protein
MAKDPISERSSAISGVDNAAGICQHSALFIAILAAALHQSGLEPWKEQAGLAELVAQGRVAKVLPTYYIAEGVYNASQRLGTLGSNALDTGVSLGSTIVLLAISAWVLRRQAATASI